LFFIFFDFQRYTFFILLQKQKSKDEKIIFTFSFIDFTILLLQIYAFWQNSSETVNFFLPRARREANTRRPFAVAILSRKPCLFLRFLLDG